MSDAPITLIFLGVITVCLIAITVMLLLTMRDLRRTLERLDALLPTGHQVLRQARVILSHANRAVHGLEAVIQHACETATDAMAEVDRWRQKARSLFIDHVGNGARLEPRRQYRK